MEMLTLMPDALGDPGMIVRVAEKAIDHERARRTRPLKPHAAGRITGRGNSRRRRKTCANPSPSMPG